MPLLTAPPDPPGLDVGSGARGERPEPGGDAEPGINPLDAEACRMSSEVGCWWALELGSLVGPRRIGELAGSQAARAASYRAPPSQGPVPEGSGVLA